MRQNEREIKFIRVGDAVTTVGQLKGESTLNRGVIDVCTGIVKICKHKNVMKDF